MGRAWHFRKKKAGSEKTPPLVHLGSLVVMLVVETSAHPHPGPGRVCADIYLLWRDPVIDNYMVNVKFLPATYALNMFNELL